MKNCYCFRIIAIVVITFFYTKSYSQYKLNYGLQKLQDTATLPKSLAAVIKPVLKSRKEMNTVLNPIGDGEFMITGGWDLISGNKTRLKAVNISKPGVNLSTWYNATVPGTILTTLVDQGVYPHPYFGLNNLSIPDTLCRQDWWYRTVFNSNKIVSGKKAWIKFNGINYMAEIWLNGERIGVIKGAFKRGVFDVTKNLKSGQNVLAVHILPPFNPGIPHEESPKAGTGPNGGKLALDGPTFISSEGWDWVPGIRDRNMGLWQDVRIKFSGEVTFSDPQVISKLSLPDTSIASLTIRTDLINSSTVMKKIHLTGKIEAVKFEADYTLRPGEIRHITITPEEFPQLKIKNPRLWWPNGYGAPNLYVLRLSVNNNDTRTVRFGIREISYEMTVDLPNLNNQRVEFFPASGYQNDQPPFDNLKRRKLSDGSFIPHVSKSFNPEVFKMLADTAMAPYLVIKVNGQRIYCRGGNWGMDDAMKQVSRRHLEPYFKLHQQAHFNMIRNWTGESTEEVFYDLCDENGMLVWNDFWLSTEGYNLNVKDNRLFLDNARDVVRRFRNHPSIALWCPRNEGFAPSGLENELAAIITKDDGTRLYQGNSRLINLRTSGPWDYLKNPELYYTRIASGFSTELGTPSIPTAASLRKMMAKEDVWPIGDVWYYHDLHDGQKNYISTIDSLYGPSDNLDDFCKKAQLVNYDSHRAMFEAWNSKLWNNTSGLLLWMTHPAWPSTVWQVYSWDYETFGSYYGAEKACEPVHIQMNLNDNQVVIINTTLKNYNQVRAALGVYDISGKLLSEQDVLIDAACNKLTNAFKAKIPAGLTQQCLIRLTLKDKSGMLISQNDYWKSYSADKKFEAFNHLPDVELTGTFVPQSGENGQKLVFRVSNNTQTVAVGIKLNAKDATTDAIILPAYFSAGYFNLLPGENKIVTVDCPSGNEGLKIISDGYNIKPFSIILYSKL